MTPYIAAFTTYLTDLTTVIIYSPDEDLPRDEIPHSGTYTFIMQCCFEEA